MSEWLRPDIDAIPAELKALPRWVLWRAEKRDGKPAKIPYQTNGARADTTDSNTWATFDAVRLA
jgi:putative DNA primase/helicase